MKVYGDEMKVYGDEMKVYIERNEEGTFSIYNASTNSEVEHGHFKRREAAQAYCWLRGWIVVD